MPSPLYDIYITRNNTRRNPAVFVISRACVLIRRGERALFRSGARAGGRIFCETGRDETRDALLNGGGRDKFPRRIYAYLHIFAIRISGFRRDTSQARQGSERRAKLGEPACRFCKFPVPSSARACPLASRRQSRRGKQSGGMAKPPSFLAFGVAIKGQDEVISDDVCRGQRREDGERRER